jgi:medium-chain acyl-[acyl-carrier-protein] hydrolase
MDLSNFKAPSYHSHSISVHSYDIDFNSRLNIFSLFNYFQEIAWEHAAILHFGLEDLSKQNLFWVLSSVRVEIERLPHWTEKMTLITYPRGNDGLFALRDYEIFDNEGKRIIAGSSSWLILSAQNRRPVRLADLNFPFLTNDRRAISVNASKVLDVNQTPVRTDKFTVKTSDIDVNYHVNNTRYIEWAYNTFPLDFHKENHLKVVEVNFLAEGKEDNAINVELYQLSDKKNTVIINRLDDSKELCRVYFEWM